MKWSLNTLLIGQKSKQSLTKKSLPLGSVMELDFKVELGLSVELELKITQRELGLREFRP